MSLNFVAACLFAIGLVLAGFAVSGLRRAPSGIDIGSAVYGVGIGLLLALALALGRAYVAR